MHNLRAINSFKKRTTSTFSAVQDGIFIGLLGYHWTAGFTVECLIDSNCIQKSESNSTLENLKKLLNHQLRAARCTVSYTTPSPISSEDLEWSDMWCMLGVVVIHCISKSGTFEILHSNLTYFHSDVPITEPAIHARVSLKISEHFSISMRFTKFELDRGVKMSSHNE